MACAGTQETAACYSSKVQCRFLWKGYLSWQDASGTHRVSHVEITINEGSALKRIFVDIPFSLQESTNAELFKEGFFLACRSDEHRFSKVHSLMLEHLPSVQLKVMTTPLYSGAPLVSAAQQKSEKCEECQRMLTPSHLQKEHLVALDLLSVLPNTCCSLVVTSSDIGFSAKWITDKEQLVKIREGLFVWQKQGLQLRLYTLIYNRLLPILQAAVGSLRLVQSKGEFPCALAQGKVSTIEMKDWSKEEKWCRLLIHKHVLSCLDSTMDLLLCGFQKVLLSSGNSTQFIDSCLKKLKPEVLKQLLQDALAPWMPDQLSAQAKVAIQKLEEHFIRCCLSDNSLLN